VATFAGTILRGQTVQVHRSAGENEAEARCGKPAGSR
jgi:hypothetical protein